MTTLDEDGFISEEINEKRDKILKEYSGLFSLTRQINQIAQKIQYLLSPNNRDPQRLLATILYRRILDFYQGAYFLASMGMDGPFKVLLRSQIEAYALLKANEADSNFFKEMVIDYDYRRLRYFKSAEKFPTSDLFSMIRSYEQFKEKLKELESRNPKRFDILSVFKRAGLEEGYESIYALLSAPTHHGLSSLEDCLIISEDKIKSILWGPNTEDIWMFFDTGSWTLYQAMISVYELFELEDKQYINEAEQIGKRIGAKSNQLSIDKKLGS